MKIDGNFFKTYSAAVYSNSERYSADNAKKRFGIKGDTVEISSDALRLEKAVSGGISREERINAIEAEVRSGRYTINAEAIADRIMEYIA